MQTSPLPGAHRGEPPAAVLFDRDGTLIIDVPYNDDPERVEAMPTAIAAVRRLRELGVPMGVLTNQSGIERGLVSRAAVLRVNARVDEEFGGFDIWRFCPHSPATGCACRKPRPGMILSAAAALGISPERLAYIGDIGSDVEAALAAGARPVLVPTAQTLPGERAAAPEVAESLGHAVDLLFGRTARIRPDGRRYLASGSAS